MKNNLFVMMLATGIIISGCNKNKNSDETTNQNQDTTFVSADEIKTDTIPALTEQDHTVVEQKQADIIKYEYSGEVMTKGGVWIIRTTLPDKSSTDFLPGNLAKEFKVEGIKVKFNGTAGEIPPNVRMAGRPFTISSIEKIN